MYRVVIIHSLLCLENFSLPRISLTDIQKSARPLKTMFLYGWHVHRISRWWTKWLLSTSSHQSKVFPTCFHLHICVSIYFMFCVLNIESDSVSHSVVSDSLWLHELYTLPGSSVHGILQARILEWVAIPFSRGSSRPRDQT